MRQPKTPLPLFYYGGSKRHGIKSDKTGIEFHLLRIPERLRQKACDEYERIYLSNLDGKFPNDRRSMANGWLVDFCNKNGISVDDMKKKLKGASASESAKEKSDSIISRMKQAAKSNRKTII